MMTESQLFTPLKVRGVEMPNRAWVSPMCMYSAVDGVVGAWNLVHLGAFASGGAGLVLTEATAVVPEGRISIGCPGIWSDEQAQAWRPTIDFAHSMNTPIGIQLAHAGRKGSCLKPWDDRLIATTEEGGWECVAPSAVTYGRFPVPRAMELDEIHAVVDAFVAAAVRSVDVGFDVVEVHAAHGYLLHQFMSPISNLRTDEYGGDFTARTRILREVATGIRAAIPETVPLFVRISGTDWVEGGWSLEDSIQLSKDLMELGVDVIDVSSGGTVPDAQIPTGPGYQVPLAEAIRAGSGVLTTAVGLITEPEQAEGIIAAGQADAVFLGRAMLRNPRWAINAAETLGQVIPWPAQLERSRLIKPRPSHH
jgi:2,4-dienoyl-CoA reductase-like NADH-dependent reductase (Old Yellow Enzyme family)